MGRLERKLKLTAVQTALEAMKRREELAEKLKADIVKRREAKGTGNDAKIASDKQGGQG